MKIKILCEGQTEEGLRTLLGKAVAVPGCGIHIKTYEGVGALLRELDDAVETELRSGARVVFCVVDYHHYPLSEITRNLLLEQRLEAIKSDVLGKLTTRVVRLCDVTSSSTRSRLGFLQMNKLLRKGSRLKIYQAGNNRKMSTT